MGEDVKTMSKLHLVDLSGSERPSQTGIDGKTLEEAKNINLSLSKRLRRGDTSDHHTGDNNRTSKRLELHY